MPFIYSSNSRRKKTRSNLGCTGCSSTHCSSCVYVYTPHAEHSLSFLPKHILSISSKSLVYVGLRFFCIENCIWNTMKEREHGAALFVPASLSALLSTLVLRKGNFSLWLSNFSRDKFQSQGCSERTLGKRQKEGAFKQPCSLALFITEQKE